MTDNRCGFSALLDYLMCSRIIEATFTMGAVAKWLVLGVPTATQRVTLTLGDDVAVCANQNRASYSKRPVGTDSNCRLRCGFC